jgi:hypothetical protein
VDGSRRRAPQALPVTFRPRNIRFVAYGLAVLIMATMAALAVIMPEGWGLQDRVFLLLLGVAIGGGLRFLARPRLELTEERVTVVNSIRTHVLVWPEIIDARMPVGEPWPSIDLADGSTLAVMAIQSSDGDLARANLDEFRRHLRERGEAVEPGRD